MIQTAFNWGLGHGKALWADSQHRNALYLLSSNGIMAFFGFFFWIINTRLFTPEQIGLSTALLSSVSLIVGFSMVGANTGIIRYLPMSDRKVVKLNTVFTLVTLTTLFAIGIYIIGLHKFAPKLVFMRENALFLAFFIVVVVLTSLESLISNTFIALRKTQYVLVNNTFKSVIKLGLPALLIGFGAFAIFVAASIGTVFVVFSSIFTLSRLVGYKLIPQLNMNVIKRMYKLSFGNYIASLLAGLPLTLLPILITNTLGARQAAFYFMAANIINILNSIQSSANYSLFAEGSSDERGLKRKIIKSTKSIAALLIPAILIIVIFGQNILNIFGKEYSQEGVGLLRLLALSLVFTTSNGIFSTILNIKGKVWHILIMCIIGPAILLSLIYFALPHGLVTLGYAWLLGEGIIALIYMLFVFHVLKK